MMTTSGQSPMADDVQTENAATILALVAGAETVAARAVLIATMRPRVVSLLDRGAATLDDATVTKLRDLVQDGDDWD